MQDNFILHVQPIKSLEENIYYNLNYTSTTHQNDEWSKYPIQGTKNPLIPITEQADGHAG